MRILIATAKINSDGRQGLLPPPLSFDGSRIRFRSNRLDEFQKLYTFDSTEVYFLAVGVTRQNAADFEYRISRNAKTLVTDWAPITRFSNLKMNLSDRGLGFLGGYKAGWNEIITVELRRKVVDSIVSAATVQWKEIKPGIVSVYTSKNLYEFFSLLKRTRSETRAPLFP